MSRFRRLIPAVLLIAAAILAFQPIVHHHALVGHGDDDLLTSATTIACSFCAIAADRMTVSAPAAVAPLIVVFVLVAIVTTPASRDLLILLPSRAPPVR